MPTYEYKCSNGHAFEVIQRMADDPVTRCEECGAPVERVFHPVAVHFKGSGFYTTDYGSKSKSSSGADEGESKSSGADEGESKSSGGDSDSSSSTKKDSSTTKSDTAAKSSSSGD